MLNIFKKSSEKELKMIWTVEKDNKRSYLVGTAHYFPFSFKSSLNRYLKEVDTVLFEGPLDPDNMGAVRRAGMAGDSFYHLFDDLDARTIDSLTTALAPVCRDKHSFIVFNLCKMSMENPVYDMVKGMKPWLAFFTIWSTYLEKNGWRYSVDLEGYTIAAELGKQIVWMETIEEQICVLESLSHERIIEFLKQVDQWPNISREYETSYLKGEPDRLRLMRLRFPSRHYSVIDQRDEIFYEKMRAYMAKGNTVAFVGAPHIRGVSRLLRKDGYEVVGPRISTEQINQKT